MADFRKRFLGLTGALAAFTGIAYGQATCTASSPGGIIRAEGTTEQVAPLIITCSGAGTPQGSVSIQATVGLPVTSKSLGNGAIEASATATGQSTVNGTLSANGTQINFSAVQVPALPGGGGSYQILIDNVRVNATSLSVGSGSPPPVTESVFLSGTPVTPTATSAVNVAFAESGISAKGFKTLADATSASATTGANNFPVCTAATPGGSLTDPTKPPTGVSNVIQINEGFQSAFKTVANEGPQLAVSGTNSNAVNSGTRIKLVFANVPSGVTIYLPTTVGSVAGGGVLTLTASETGALSAVTATTPSSTNGLSGLNAAVAAIATSGGTGTAIYEVTADNLSVTDQYNVPVWVWAPSNTVTPSSAAMTTSVSFAPTGSTNVPNFVIGSSTTAITGSLFQPCTTSLLFPYVVNGLGFDTGIVLSNTSTDPFGSNGAKPSPGACTLNFYGTGAPTPATGVNAPGGSQASGTVNAFLLSSVAPGFQGYMIAVCNYQYGHGLAFIAYNLGQNNGATTTYIPLELNGSGRSVGGAFESLGQ
jgi:hypothetical protein